jgi:cytochrome P450
MLTFFIAGHETTASGLLWTFYHLATNPRVEVELLRELERVVEGRAVSIEHYADLPFARRVIDEVQRLTPSTWFFGRTALEDMDLGGARIKKGALVALSSPSLHRNEKSWPDPERFDPDRFLPEVAARRSPDSYIPFGRGAHVCIGKHFALQELVLVTAVLARRFRLVIESRPFDPEDVNAGVSMSPRGGIQMRAERRHASHATKVRAL